MKRPIAIVDLDDTMFALGHNLCTSLNYYCQKDFTVQDFHDFNLTDLYDISLKKFNEIIIKDYLLEEITPVPGAVSSMQALEETHDIVICTSRGYHPNAHHITKRTLAHHLVQYDHLVIVEQGQSKSDAYAALGLGPAEVVFDDGLHNIQDLLETNTVAEAYVPNQPWNCRNIPEAIKGKFYRQRSFRECVNMYLARFEGLVG